MIAFAHLFAIASYLGATAVAATPFARPVRAPWRVVVSLLFVGVVAHVSALALFARSADAVPLTGLGPALSFAGLVLATTLVVVELLACDASLTLVAAPLAALPTLCAALVGLTPGRSAAGLRGVWLLAHIGLSFVGIAAFATAAVAGMMYLLQRRELKSRRFGTIFRLFPPLETLDRVNHVAAVAGWLVLTLGVVLAISYSVAYRELNLPQLVWGSGAWVAVSCVAIGRVMRGWQARRAALISSVGFAAVLLLYVAFRVAMPATGQFL